MWNSTLIREICTHGTCCASLARQLLKTEEGCPIIYGETHDDDVASAASNRSGRMHDSLHVRGVIYSRLVQSDHGPFVGGAAGDPVFEVMAEAVAAPTGEPIQGYARPLTDEQTGEFYSRLDAIEPAHASAAARLHTLFAG